MSTFKVFESTEELRHAIEIYFQDTWFHDVSNKYKIIKTYGDISNWNTSQITCMDKLFINVNDIFGKVLTLNWDTSNVTSMHAMFQHCHVNFKLNFNCTANVTDMSYMFYKSAKFDTPINFDTSKVTNMSYMFSHTNFNSPINFTDTSNVLDMSFMFDCAYKFNQPINFNTSNVKIINKMFYYAKSFNQPLNFDLRNLKNLDDMFNFAIKFNKALNFINTSNIVSMCSTFEAADYFNQPINWDISNVKYIHRLFHFAHSFNQPVQLNTSITIGDYIFSGAINFNQPIYFRKIISPNAIHAKFTTNYDGEINIINNNNKYVLSDCDYYKLMLIFALSQINANWVLDVDWDFYDEVY